MFSILVQCYNSVLPRKCVEKDADEDAESAPTTSPGKAAGFRESAKPPSTLFTSAYSQFSKIFTAQDRTLGVARETTSDMTTASAAPGPPLLSSIDGNMGQKRPLSMSSGRRLDDISEVGQLPTQSPLAPKSDDSSGLPTPTLSRSSRVGVSGISSSRPAPSPAPSRHSSLRARTRSRSRPVSTALSIASSTAHSQGDVSASDNTTSVGTQKKGKSRRSAIIRVRDYAFPPSDGRHLGTLTLSSSRNSVSSYASRFSGFASRFGFGFGARREESPSRASTPTNDGEETADDEYEERVEMDRVGQGAAGEGSVLLPGIYRAVYDFEPQGAHEMALQEDQLVFVLGNGGGDGWAVVLDEGTDERFLVPAEYLEWHGVARDQDPPGDGKDSNSTSR